MSFSIADFYEVANFVQGMRGIELKDNSGYLYRSSEKRKSKIYWKCSMVHFSKCRARAVTDGVHVVSFTGEHNHLLPETSNE